MEKIDDETDALDITMVKVNDARYAKKYGVNKMPALVYFRRKFPSIYRDNLFDEDTILEWLTSNRFTNKKPWKIFGPVKFPQSGKSKCTWCKSRIC